MNSLLSILGLDGVSAMLGIALIIVSVLLGIALITAGVCQIMVFFGYYKGNHRAVSSNMNGLQAARQMLDENGMNDVQVKRAGIFRAFFFGNHYSPKYRTVYLRGWIATRCSVTSVTLAVQKVGLAMMHRDGNRSVVTRSAFLKIAMFGPVMFLPLTAIGLILDLVFFDFTGWVTLTFACIGLSYTLFAFIVQILNIKVEKEGNRRAMELLQRSTVLDSSEINMASDIYRAYLVSYVMEFIVSVLRIIQLVIKILFIVASRKK